jgi:hypothetical protein
VCVCVCVCVWRERERERELGQAFWDQGRSNHRFQARCAVGTDRQVYIHIVPTTPTAARLLARSLPSHLFYYYYYFFNKQYLPGVDARHHHGLFHRGQARLQRRQPALHRQERAVVIRMESPAIGAPSGCKAGQGRAGQGKAGGIDGVGWRVRHVLRPLGFWSVWKMDLSFFFLMQTCPPSLSPPQNPKLTSATARPPPPPPSRASAPARTSSRSAAPARSPCRSPAARSPRRAPG